ncbi:MAG: dehydratase, partial [Alphaproteobacteria bacterium]|nr:dehydratase [Alphaproteobacteria bacterium]
MIDKPFGEMKVGDSKISTGRTITETDIVNFAMFMGSWLELQTNDEFAQHTVYGKRIAQGPMVYTIAVGLLGYEGEILSALA